jgi:hypothetical protein
MFDFLLFSSFEVIGKSRVWYMVKVNPNWCKVWSPHEQGNNDNFEWIDISTLPHQEFLLT